MFIFSSLAYSEPQTLFSKNQPIEITADLLKADQQTGITVFEGSVIARQGDTILRADSMKVYTDKQGNIQRIVAIGNVKLERNGQQITAQQAEYFHKKGIIIFTGKPVAQSKDTTVMGKKIIYYTSDGKTIVEHSHVILYRKSNGNP